ncbi:palmitoyltransferase ZDHHC23 isoform X2 [Dromaius novaehollandiae]|uniref:palmitoyltransferase ZDHHC23 isoform X2 n=1 Tax=Dromaius novaehollandiae TaxID=8790 RepID=UPI00311DEF32
MEEPLCCCEYVDRKGERNHLVACFCDCEDLDEGCERWLTCKSLPPGTLERIADAIADRVRVPWFTGAVKINISLVPPLLMLPVFLHVAALHFLLALVILTSLPMVVLWYYYLTHRRKERTLFFLSLGLFSLGYMYCVFLQEVVPRGHVGYSQVVVLTCGLILMLAALSRAKKDPGYLSSPTSNDKSSCRVMDLPSKKVTGSCNGLHGVTTSGATGGRTVNGETKGYSRLSAEEPEGIKKDWCTKCQLVRPARAGHCRLCGRCVRRLDHHCVWINSCVGEQNHQAFILALSLFMLTSLYGILLTLDTVCRGRTPFVALFYCPGAYSDYRAELHEVLEEYKEGAAKFIGMPDTVLYCSLQDPVAPCPSGYNTNKELQGSVMIGAIEGGDILEERLRSARETAKRPVGGFLLDGFQGCAMAKETKLKLIASVTAELPEDKPRIIHGIGKPDEVLECIERGVDVFESFFPFQVTERGCALSFSYDYHPNSDAAILKQNRAQDPEKNNAEKDQDEIFRADSAITPFEIFLKDKRYQDDFGPLLEGCSCYCCQRHTRAYVHHLLVTNELLAGVLLMMHNFQHYFSFFSAIRDALRDNKLDQLKKLIFRQALQGSANAKPGQ